MLIAFAGKAGVGKDHAGDLICREQGAIRVALADPMKRIVRDVYGFTDEQLWGSSEHRAEPVERLGGLTARHALQQLGTEWARACYENTWVDILIRTYRQIELGKFGYNASEGLFKTGTPELSIQYTAPHVVCTDVRFLDEVAAINQAGGRVIHILRPTRQNLQGAAALHASENSLEGIRESAFACTIQNDGTVATLDHMVRAAFQHVVSGAEGRLWLSGTLEAVAL